MHPKIVRLLCNLHVASWFTFGFVDAAIAVFQGGRQGCKFGAAVFNSTFALAMRIISEELVEAGVALSLGQGPPNFWYRSSSADANGAVEGGPARK